MMNERTRHVFGLCVLGGTILILAGLIARPYELADPNPNPPVALLSIITGFICLVMTTLALFFGEADDPEPEKIVQLQLPF